MKREQIHEADRMLRSMLATLFWQRDMDPNCQSLDDVAQECWLVMLDRGCTNQAFVWTVAKLCVVKLIERQTRKRERSYNVARDNGREWYATIAHVPRAGAPDNGESVVEKFYKDFLRRTATAIIANDTIAGARRDLGITKTTMQRHRKLMAECLS